MGQQPQATPQEHVPARAEQPWGEPVPVQEQQSWSQAEAQNAAGHHEPGHAAPGHAAPGHAAPVQGQAAPTGGAATAVAERPGTQQVPSGQVVASAVDLVKVYGSDKTQVVALDHVSVQFQRGSFTAIMGPSGSGKSTLMHCLAGLDRITSGRIFLAGLELNALNDAALTNVRRDKVGFIFQSFNLLPTLTARQNILLPLDLAGRKPDEAYFKQLVDSLGLSDRLDHRPSELSGGQQQRVAIARAMVTRPDVIFADEPTGALDSKTGTNLLEYMQESVRTLGQTIIMVTHDAKAAGYADRALVLLDGKIVDDVANPTAERMGAALTSLEA